MEVIIKENYEEISALAAEMIARVVRRKPDAVLGLATGSTPLGTYRELIRLLYPAFARLFIRRGAERDEADVPFATT